MPKKFIPINSSQIGAVVNQVNRNFAMIDKEVDTKTYGGQNGTDSLTIGRTGTDTVGLVVKQAGKKVLEIGIYRAGRAGMLVYDSNEVPVELYGQAPDDGRAGSWVIEPGENVLTELGG